MDWTIIVTIVTICATIANVKKKSWSFILYIITDVVWFVVDYRAGLYGQSILFVGYIIIAFWGWYEWTKQGREVANEN